MKNTISVLITLLILAGACAELGKTSRIPASENKSDTPPIVATPRPTPPAGAWRSSLYPEDWTPQYKDAQGRFLADFSYAGFYDGGRGLPSQVAGPIKDVTVAPYLADNTGSRDSTLNIQRAIDDIAAVGGGTVYLPAGIYKVKPTANFGYALIIKSSNILFKGAGANLTYIFNDETAMREKDVIRVSPDATTKYSWHWLSAATASVSTDISQDLVAPTDKIPVVNASIFHVGEWVMVLAEATADFIADHNMTGKWTSQGLGNLLFYRQITAIDINSNTLTIDSPTKYYLLKRDRARVSKVRDSLHDIGLEDFSIGMKQVKKSDLKDADYNKVGTVSYQVHQSHAITINHTVNSWVRRVSSYKPASNPDDVHVLSNGLHLFMSKNITVDNCDFRKALYQGEGGNGYLFVLQGQDNLILNSNAEDGRHNYDFSGLETSGNVILASRSRRGRLPSDFHMYLSPSNLVDSVILDEDYFSAVYRDTATPKHGYGTTQSVFWNVKALNPKNSIKFNYAIETQQFGWGYVIGTSGKTNAVKAIGGFNSEPVDFVEGIGIGEKLYPPSLYLDQLSRRLSKN